MFFYFCVDGFNPIGTNWFIPIFLLDAGEIVFLLPDGLPVLWAGIAEAREDKDVGLESHGYKYIEKHDCEGKRFTLLWYSCAKRHFLFWPSKRK